MVRVKYQPSPWLGLAPTRGARSCTARSAIAASSPAPPPSGRGLGLQLILPGEVLLEPQEPQAVELRLLTDR